MINGDVIEECNQATGFKEIRTFDYGFMTDVSTALRWLHMNYSPYIIGIATCWNTV